MIVKWATGRDPGEKAMCKLANHSPIDGVGHGAMRAALKKLAKDNGLTARWFKTVSQAADPTIKENQLLLLRLNWYVEDDNGRIDNVGHYLIVKGMKRATVRGAGVGRGAGQRVVLVYDPIERRPYWWPWNSFEGMPIVEWFLINRKE